MIQRVLKAGFLAGLVVGLAVAVLQQLTTSQLILQGEVYEKAAHDHHAAVNSPALPIVLVHDHGSSAASTEPEEEEDEGWQPAEGWQRIMATSVATIATSIGYALILLAAMLAAGVPIVPRTALLWGIAAFAATSLAPALGLSPELPGSAGAPLLSRQLWWVATALCTAGGIFLLARIDYLAAKIVGVALIVAPHILGAPQTAKFKSTAPAELAAQFAATSLVVSAVLWTLLGLAVGYAWQRVARSQTEPVPA
ncbi:MAG: CbtA family protein [Methylobacteriaceae bacterium]|nr:CbtA family protein [Methylobacteriaceae bacterium]